MGLLDVIGYPQYRHQTYQPSPWTQEVYGQLQRQMARPGVQRTMQRGSARQLGRMGTQAHRQLVGRLGQDPALLANALANLQATLARSGTEATERASLAGAQERQATLGQMGGLAGLRERIQESLRRLNLEQRWRQGEYMQDLWAGLLRGAGAVGAGAIGAGG